MITMVIYLTSYLKLNLHYTLKIDMYKQNGTEDTSIEYF